MKTEKVNTDTTAFDSLYPERIVVYLDVIGFSNRVNEIGKDLDKFSRVREIHQTIQAYIDQLNNWNEFSPELVDFHCQTMHDMLKEAKQSESIPKPIPYPEPTDPKLAEKMKPFLKSFQEFGSLTTHGFITGKNMHIQSMLMSDSIVMHASPEAANAFNLVSILTRLSRDLLLRGTLLRGAIVLGRLHHSGNSIFGRALVEAVHLEEDVAKVPRILIQPPLSKIKEFYYDSTFEANHHHDSFVKRDADGLYFIDIFSADHESRLVTQADGQKKNFYTEVRGVIIDLMEKTKSPKEWSKTAWLANRFNAVVTKYPSCGGVLIDVPAPPAPH